MVGLMLIVSSCSASNPIGPSTRILSGDDLGRSPDSHGTLTAFIDGVLYQGTIVSATRTRTVLSIKSMSDDETQSIDFETMAEVGAYNVLTSDAVHLDVVETDRRTVTTWTASRDNGGSGLLKILSVDSRGASGTFDFVAPPAPGSRTSTWKAVTEGRFDATF